MSANRSPNLVLSAYHRAARVGAPTRLATVITALGLLGAPALADPGYRHDDDRDSRTEQAGEHGDGRGHGEHGGHSEAYGAAGRILVDNDRGEQVFVTIDGRGMGSIAPYAALDFVVSVGGHLVVVRDARGQLLEQDSVQVGSRGTAMVQVDRVIMGRLSVSNPLDRPVELRVDGRTLEVLAPFERTSMALPVGTVRLDLALPGGRVIATELERIDARSISAWAPHPALLGELVIENPLPIGVQVSDGRGRVTALAPYGRTVLRDLPEGLHRYTVRRGDGPELVGNLDARVEAFETARATVPVPRTGILVVINDRYRPVEVRVDGRFVAIAEAGRDTRLELSPGRHRVELVSTRSGRVIDVEQPMIVRYEPARLTVPERSPNGGYQRWEDDDRDTLSLSFVPGRGVQVTAQVDLD